jgi:hypothetical protein
MTPWQKVTERLKIKGSGPVFSAKCPAHEDRHESLSVTQNAHGDVLLTCHAGCDVERIVERLGLEMRDLFLPDDRPLNSEPIVYTYRDERGTPLYEVHKWVKDGAKKFAQRVAGSAEWGLKDVRRVLYRLPELLRAKPSEVVYVVEGEKDVENAMSKLGLVATCNLGGAGRGKWKVEYNEFFAERNVVVIPDNDEVGKEHAGEVAQHLAPIAASVIVCELPGLDNHGDLSDWIRRGGTREQLAKLVEAARIGKHPHVVLPVELHDKVFELYHAGLSKGMSTGWSGVDKHYTVRLGEWTVITGAPGAGKSTFADALCLNLAQAGQKVGIYSAENIPIERHMSTFAERYVGKPFEEPRTQFGRERMSERELEIALSFIEDKFFFIEPQEKGQTIEEILEAATWMVENGCSILLIDPWTELNHDRPKSMTETEFIAESLWKLRRFARSRQVHPILVAHPAKLSRGKDGKYPIPTLYDISGSAQWNNMADNGLVVYRDRDSDDNVTELHVQKIRFREIGRTGMVRLGFDRPTGRFSNLEEPDLFRGGMDDDD